MKKILSLLLIVLICTGLAETKRSYSRRLRRKGITFVNCDNKNNIPFCAWRKTEAECNNSYDKEDRTCKWNSSRCSTEALVQCEYIPFYKRIFSR